MAIAKEHNLHLTSTWFIKPDCEEEALIALSRLAEDVRMNEPGTLGYFVHKPHRKDHRITSLPPVDPFSILFFEIYRDVDAFLQHVNGPIFTGFVRRHGDLFVSSNGSPFTFVEFLKLHAGFIRPVVLLQDGETTAPCNNRHPSVMFEIIAKNQAGLKEFYSEVFDWRYQNGSDGFAYIHFGVQTLALLGGIGQANDSPGFNPGHNFYLRVGDLTKALDKALAAGASVILPPTGIDGYRFAMIEDPEGNPIGLIQPFG